ncbi:hypothetical protein GCM10009677_28250 [Sphaerisporangium rubeum]|uniref:Uncharacterized protein n=1 Tax=Sphaerisporangium rubeum TaxID=321317 RepID=A0A7X0ICX2_9ACTN|nr:hypothetical protein [Sphaerisporangium rubeum]MBB6472934.1 hypothetical protein [Sphaerisporangium rubeum]
MPETWVHGNVFIPRLYGPDNLRNIDNIGWTDQQGLKEGHVARFFMLDEKQNYFHAPVPVTGQPQLLEVRVEFSSTYPRVFQAWVHAAGRVVAQTDAPVVNNIGGESIFVLGGINRPVNRGLCISLGFTTQGQGLGPGEINFRAAGAVFA